MEISGRGSTYPEMFCALERFDSAQFLSHAARTHTLPFPRTRSNNTHKHTSTPWTPSFSFFPSSLSFSACLSRISAALSILPSVHLLIRSTGRSGNVQTLLSWPSGSPYTTACHPDPGIQTRCLTEGINHPCTTGQDALSPPHLEWVPVPSATADTGVSM